MRNGNCKYHLGEETFKLAQTYMDKLSKHGQQANRAALYGELCALLFAKSHYDEVSWLFVLRQGLFVAHTGLENVMFSPQPLKCWGCRHVPHSEISPSFTRLLNCISCIGCLQGYFSV